MKMSRKLFICLTLSLLALVVGVTRTQAQSFKWWKNDRFIKELALTPDQSRANRCRVPGGAAHAARAEARARQARRRTVGDDPRHRRWKRPSSSTSSAASKRAKSDLSKSRTMHDRAHEPRADRRAEHQAAPAVRTNVTSSARNGRTTRSRSSSTRSLFLRNRNMNLPISQCRRDRGDSRRVRLGLGTDTGGSTPRVRIRSSVTPSRATRPGSRTSQNAADGTQRPVGTPAPGGVRELRLDRGGPDRAREEPRHRRRAA